MYVLWINVTYVLGSDSLRVALRLCSHSGSGWQAYIEAYRHVSSLHRYAPLIITVITVLKYSQWRALCQAALLCRKCSIRTHQSSKMNGYLIGLLTVVPVYKSAPWVLKENRSLTALEDTGKCGIYPCHLSPE